MHIKKKTKPTQIDFCIIASVKEQLLLFCLYGKSQVPQVVVLLIHLYYISTALQRAEGLALLC